MKTAIKQKFPGLLSFWPSDEEVNRIGTEAETLEDAVLLAVHRKIDILRRPFGGNDPGNQCHEEALLEFVLSGLKPEGYLLAPITGPSGAGKSHLVRWLEIRLRNHTRAARFNVIRVPKSASLRTVVEAVLEPVAHLPEYAEMLHGLREATSALAPGEAAALFGTTMQLGLREKAIQWRQGGTAIDNVDPSILSIHAQQLSSFLQDPVIAPYFHEQVFPRLLTRALRGRDETSEDADRPPHFELEDLVLPPNVASQIGDAARSTQVYYLTRLERNGGRPAALTALNAVVDGAVARVFKLGQLSHGKTLQDIMREVREALHGSGRELVLLVEDFYALTGIQEQLLSLCIQGVNDGPRPMCPMRTVLAMTDGTLVGRDTISTRSEFEWVLVTEDPQNDHVIDGLVDLAGRYLNAARIGRQRLIESYDATKGTVQLKFTPDIDDPESSDLRQAFGSTVDGVPLFPLSRGAIQFLAQKHLVDGGRLRFNPRRALQRIVRDVLLARQFFEQGNFPAGIAIQDPLAVELTSVLSRVPDVLKDRYQRTIVCWGNDPRTSAELQRLPAGVFTAFGLAPLLDAGSLPPTHAPISTPTSTPISTPTSTPIQTPTDPAAAIGDVWRPRLDKWVRGQRLVLADAQTLRLLIHEHLVSTVDWNALSLDPKEFDAQSFSLPCALGNDRQHRLDRPVLQVTGPTGRVDVTEAELARELLALLRFGHVKSKDYADAEEDFLYAGAFIERMSRKLEQLALEAAELKLVPLAHGALWSGTIRAGVAPVPALSDKLKTALNVSDTEPERSDATGWDDLRRECWNQREVLRRALMRYIRVVQGDADAAYAVDAARFERALKTAAPDAAGISKCLDKDEEITANLRVLLPKLTVTRLKPIIHGAMKLIQEWMQVVLTDTGLGGTHDESATLSGSAILLMDAALKASVWPTPTSSRETETGHESMTQAAQIFASLPWADLATRCRSLNVLDRAAEPLRAASMLALMDWKNLYAARSFIERYTSLLANLERLAGAAEAVIGKGDAQEALTAVSSALGTFEVALNDLQKD